MSGGGSDHRKARDRGIYSQPAASRAAVGGVPPVGRRIRGAAGSGLHSKGRMGFRLVVQGPLRDQRAPRPRRYPRLLPALWSESQRVERGKSVTLRGREPRAHPRAVGKSFGTRAGRRAHALARPPPRRAQGTSTLAADRLKASSSRTELARRCGNLDQFGNLRFRKRRLERMRSHGLFDDRVKTDDLVRREHLLREELAQALGDTFRYAGELRVALERGGIGIHPVDSLPIGLHEPTKHSLSLLQRIRVSNEHADRVAPDRGNVGCSRHNTDFAFLDGIDPEWRLRPADIDATRHDLIEARGRSPDYRRPGL